MKSFFKKIFPCLFRKPVPKKIQFPKYPTYFEFENFYFHNHLNDHREKLGLQKLKRPHDAIIDMCIDFTFYMQSQGKASHNRQFLHHEYLNQIFGAQVDCRECTADNYSSVESYFNALLNSPKHKAALEHPEMNHACVCFSNCHKYLIVFLYKLKS